MSNESEPNLIDAHKPTTSSNQTSENDDFSSVEAKSSKSSDKRTFLEVNNLEKYKSFMIKPLETKRFKTSDALSKVRDFLPILKQSTDKLLEDYRENPDQVNIEHVDEEDEHIEMNLALVAQSDSDDESEEDDYDEEEEEIESDVDENTQDNRSNENDSSSNSIEDLQLGFKVKDTTKIKKLKLPESSNLNINKKQLVKILNDDENESKEEQTENSQSNE